MTDRSLVIGASGGIGAAWVRCLRARGDHVVALSRSRDGLDITDEAAVRRAAADLEGQAFRRILVATGALTIDGAPPERRFAAIDPAVMASAFAVNAIGPMLLFKHLASLLPRTRPGVFAVLSARLASIGDNRLGGWTSYRASKAALNQIVRCAAIEIGRRRKQAVCVALHPGTVETALTRPYARDRYTATADEAAAQLLGILDGLGPEANGGFFDYAGEVIAW